MCTHVVDKWKYLNWHQHDDSGWRADDFVTIISKIQW